MAGTDAKLLAEEARASLVAGLYAGTYIEPTSMTLGDWIIDHWIALVTERAKPTTVASYRSIVGHHVLPTVGGVRIHDVTSEHLDASYTRLLTSGRLDGRGGLHRRTVGNVHRLIHLALSDAQAAGVIKDNPADDAHPPPRTAVRTPANRAWEPEDVERFLDSVQGDPLQAVWHLAALTGMRRGEIAAIRCRNIDLKESPLFVCESRTRVGTSTVSSTPKSGRARTVELDRATVETLRAHRRKQPVPDIDVEVFTYPDGRPLRPEYLSERFLRLSAKAGLRRIRFHDLRHTHATLALRAGHGARRR